MDTLDIKIIEVLYDDDEGLKSIGRLRFTVWHEEGSIDESLFPDKCWVDQMDAEPTARHFCAMVGDTMVGCARLTTHYETDFPQYRDVKLFQDKGVPLAFPVCDLGRLVVSKKYRNRGIATMLNNARVALARSLPCGVNAIICTASAPNMMLLMRDHSFTQLGHTACFPDRPAVPFHAIHLIL
jgi:predicted GNAT family N-acyltransferase